MSGINALLSDHFYYFGDKPINVPNHLAPIIHRTQGHKSQRNAPYEKAFASWIQALGIAANRLYGNPQGKPPMVLDPATSAACADPNRQPLLAVEPTTGAALVGPNRSPRPRRRSC